MSVGEWPPPQSAAAAPQYRAATSQKRRESEDTFDPNHLAARGKYESPPQLPRSNSSALVPPRSTATAALAVPATAAPATALVRAGSTTATANGKPDLNRAATVKPPVFANPLEAVAYELVDEIAGDLIPDLLVEILDEYTRDRAFDEKWGAIARSLTDSLFESGVEAVVRNDVIPNAISELVDTLLARENRSVTMIESIVDQWMAEALTTKLVPAIIKLAIAENVTDYFFEKDAAFVWDAALTGAIHLECESIVNELWPPTAQDIAERARKAAADAELAKAEAALAAQRARFVPTPRLPPPVVGETVARMIRDTLAHPEVPGHVLEYVFSEDDFSPEERRADSDRYRYLGPENSPPPVAAAVLSPQSAAAASASAEPIEGDVLLWSNEEISPEEARAGHERYRVVAPLAPAAAGGAGALLQRGASTRNVGPPVASAVPYQPTVGSVAAAQALALTGGEILEYVFDGEDESQEERRAQFYYGTPPL